MDDPFTKQLTEDEAIAFYKSDKWKEMTLDEIAAFQLFQDLLCVPFDKFHEAMEHALGRPVWTHEFAFHQRMIDEYLGIKGKATMEEIINLIPKEKLIIIKA